MLAPDGDLLLIVEINHKPTVTEPQTFSADIIDEFDACTLVSQKTFAINKEHNVYLSIDQAVPPATASTPAIMCCRLRKN